MLVADGGGGGGDTRSGDGAPPKDNTYDNWFWGQLRDIASELASENEGAIVKRIFGNVLGWNTTPRGSGETPYDELHPNYAKGLLTRPGYQAEIGQGDTWPVHKDNCQAGNSAAYYMPLDRMGRAQGIHACLTEGDFGYVTGKGDYRGNTSSWIFGSPTPFPPDRESTPRGFISGLMQRGHILANQLGGTGLDRRNLLPLYTAVNSPRMSAVEKVVADRIANHETMYYEVTAGYTGENLVPDSVKHFVVEYDDRGE
ncbi:DNA/RNA non-specific endonuclease [Streptomyces sp. NPDC004059]